MLTKIVHFPSGLQLGLFKEGPRYSVVSASYEYLAEPQELPWTWTTAPQSNINTKVILCYIPLSVSGTVTQRQQRSQRVGYCWAIIANMCSLFTDPKKKKVVMSGIKMSEKQRHNYFRFLYKQIPGKSKLTWLYHNTGYLISSASSSRMFFFFFFCGPTATGQQLAETAETPKWKKLRCSGHF